MDQDQDPMDTRSFNSDDEGELNLNNTDLISQPVSITVTVSVSITNQL